MIMKNNSKIESTEESSKQRLIGHLLMILVIHSTLKKKRTITSEKQKTNPSHPDSTIIDKKQDRELSAIIV